MRHTLIPTEEKKALHREYHIRLFVVALFALSAVSIIGMVGLFPAFMEASVEEVSQIHVVGSLAEQQKNDQTSQFKDELIAAKNISLGLSSQIKTSLLSDAVIAVVAARGDAIISSISAMRNASSTVIVSVQGSASTRKVLLAFEDKIKSTISGVTVVVPPEELVQAKNVKFSFKVYFDTP